MNRLTLVLLSSLMLSACGGGGGGGGGTSSSGSDAGSGNSSGSSSGQEEAGFTADQNTFLPLIENAGWSYYTSGGQVSMRAEAQTADSIPDGAFGFSNDLGSLGTLIQYFSSDSNSVVLQGLDGPISITSGATQYRINSVRFNSPITVIGDDLSNTTTSANVSVTINNLLTLPVTFDANVSVTNEVTETSIMNPDADADWSGFPAVESVVTIVLQGTGAVVGLDLTITETSQFVEGIGLVYRNLAFSGLIEDTIEMSIVGLLDIPDPIVYVLNQSTPVLSGSADVSVGGFALDASDYTVLNGSTIDSLDWISIDENTAFTVNMSASENLPSNADSRVIYIQENGSTDQIPVNVTLKL